MVDFGFAFEGRRFVLAARELAARPPRLAWCRGWSKVASACAGGAFSTRPAPGTANARLYISSTEFASYWGEVAAGRQTPSRRKHRRRGHLHHPFPGARRSHFPATAQRAWATDGAGAP